MKQVKLECRLLQILLDPLRVHFTLLYNFRAFKIFKLIHEISDCTEAVYTVSSTMTLTFNP